MFKTPEKLIFSLKTERSINTLNICSKVFQDWLGLRISETFFFKHSLMEDIESVNKLDSRKLTDENFVIIKDKEDLNCYKSIPRKLDFIPLNEWFSRNSICLALEYNRNIIAYSWLHFDSYDNFHRIGTFQLSDKEAWLGPDYVKVDYRGKGLSYPLISQSLKYAKGLGIHDVYTSCNSGNNASIRYHTKSGFCLIGFTRTRKFKDRVILDLTNEHILKKKII